MTQTHKRPSAGAALALAAGLALSFCLVSPTGRAYAWEEPAQATNHVTSYHVKITPAAELGEAWVQRNPDGAPLQVRMDLQSPQEGPKVVLLSKGKSGLWVKNKKILVFTPDADELQRISEWRALVDPKLALERLKAAEAAGKVELTTKQPSNDSDPIMLTVTPKTRPNERRCTR